MKRTTDRTTPTTSNCLRAITRNLHNVMDTRNLAKCWQHQRDQEDTEEEFERLEQLVKKQPFTF